ncbi:hypothetical protein FKQ62_08255 [Vibrio sp. B1-2]|nr:Imm26 family immunity protein [Vibrio sp. B1-2]NNN99465.1 hypothetical protein [Vibrio sp. B1-2]
MSFKRVRWEQGSVYGIPLEDGSFGICQAIDLMMPNVVYIAVFSYQFKELPETIPTLKRSDILSLGATWKQDLNNGTWASIAKCEPIVRKADFPNEAFAEDDYIGAVTSDSGLYSEFLAACFGLIPWNTMFKPNYWDEYLNSGKSRPSSVKVLSEDARNKYRSEVMGVKST